jgi:anti-sigma regulatory factor (Ser/Thr protein kinase)
LDTISVSIPASPEYVSVIRLIASGLASRLRFTIDEIEDLKIAVDELCAYLTGSQGRDGSLDLRFGVDGEALEITGVGHFTGQENLRTELTEFSQMILDTVADSASLGNQNGAPSFSLMKRKQT